MKKLFPLIISALAISSNLACYADSFDFELYKKLARYKAKENVLISPFSINTALSMTALGAAGTTYSAMAKVLDWKESIEEITQKNKNVLADLNKIDSETTVAIANNLFANKKARFKKTFIDSAKQNYNADPTNLNFASPEAVKLINGWIAQKTKGKIPSLIDKIDPTATLFLVNAAYFKSNWADKFDESSTAPKSFHTASEQLVKVPTMLAERKHFHYFDTPEFQALCLPYKDSRLRLLLFLPSEDSSLEDFESGLTQEKWHNWTLEFKQRPGKITLPKFKIQDNMKLREPLKAMGMSEAFNSDKANFSNMVGAKEIPNTCIGDVLHKTMIEVNEKGTEAAAATSVEMAAKSIYVEPAPYFEMKINRPFMFAIYDDKTEKILFLGHVADPSIRKGALK